MKLVEGRARHMTWTLSLGMIFLAILVRIICHPLVINHDAAGLLHLGQMLLEGKLPGVGYICVNPMNSYLSAIPVAIANLLPVHLIAIFSTLILSILILSTLTTRTIILSSRIAFSVNSVDAILTAFAGLSLLYMFESGLGLEFGQREHVFVLLYAPLFTARCVRWEGSPVGNGLALAVGIAAAIGACIKPHFVAITLLVEGYWFLRKRSVRPFFACEAIAYVCTGLLYACHFLLMPEAAADQIFNRWVPLFEHSYSAFNTPLSIFVWTPAFILFLFTLVTIPLAFLIPERDPALAGMVRALAVCTIGGILSFWAQNKLWNYHLLPAVYPSALVTVISAVQIAKSLKQRRTTGNLKFYAWCSLQTLATGLFLTTILVTAAGMYRGLLLIEVALLIVVCLVPFGRRIVGGAARFYRERCQPTRLPVIATVVVFLLVGISPWETRDSYWEPHLAEAIDTYSKPGDPILVISTSMIPAYPLLVQMNRRPASRFFHTAIIAMLYEGTSSDKNGTFPYRTGEGVPDQEKRFLRDLAEDITSTRPPLIIIADYDRPQACPTGFDLKDYLTASGFIDSSMTGYSVLPKKDGDNAYIYVLDALQPSRGEGKATPAVRPVETMSTMAVKEWEIRSRVSNV